MKFFEDQFNNPLTPEQLAALNAEEGTKVLHPKPEHVGMQLGDRGVYLGTWTPTERDGSSIGKNFYVFAAPMDLMDDSGEVLVAEFKETAQQVAALTNWNGHNGSPLANDQDLCTALKERKYGGEWVIPPLQIVNGQNYNLKQEFPNNYFALKDYVPPKNAFLKNIYWSCTQYAYIPTMVCAASLRTGDLWCGEWTLDRNPCRVCRFEPAP
jgi:hypothetical protein